MKLHPYAGMWTSSNGKVRHELMPDGRYRETRRDRATPFEGRYTITGDHIDYADDIGFTADGEFVGGVLYHAGMVMLRLPQRQ